MPGLEAAAAKARARTMRTAGLTVRICRESATQAAAALALVIRSFPFLSRRARLAGRRPPRPSSSTVSSHRLIQPGIRPSLSRRAMDRIKSWDRHLACGLRAGNECGRRPQKTNLSPNWTRRCVRWNRLSLPALVIRPLAGDAMLEIGLLK